MANNSNTNQSPQLPNQPAVPQGSILARPAISGPTDKLQNYVTQKKDVYVTKPEYEIRFYSRFDTSTKLASESIDQVSVKGMEDFPPTCLLSSNNTTNTVPEVLSIDVTTTIGRQASMATITLVNPNNTEYFLPTLGQHGTTGTDYDSLGADTPSTRHRIGIMDTVIISLGNTGLVNFAKYGNSVTTKNVVFRGLVSSVVRHKSPGQGSLLTINLIDFALFLQAAVAVKLNYFSTLVAGGTGRGLTAELVNYVNSLYNNKITTVVGTNLPITFNESLQQFISSGLQAVLSASPQNGQITNDTSGYADTSSGDHSMYSPPYFYLEYSKKLGSNTYYLGSADMPTKVGNGTNDTSDSAMGGSVPASTYAANGLAAIPIVGALSSTISSLFGSQNATPSNPQQSSIAQVVSQLLKTPEDVEASNFYNQAFKPQDLAADTAKVFNNSTSGPGNGVVSYVSSLLQSLQNNAWTATDLYLDKLIMNFEHERIWPLMQRIADRAMREVYVDFAPKLSRNASTVYDAATVPECKNVQNLKNIHPNVAILKYRLSPFLVPYNDQVATASNFFMYDITDDQIVQDDTTESQESVYTAAISFGSGIDKASIANDIAANLGGEAKNLFAYAQTPDKTIEKRIGYRFMSDHDMMVRIPVLMYLTSEVQLIRSQQAMFTDDVTIQGNPNIQPGSIVRKRTANTDYYCVGVNHSFNLRSGYTTSLALQYGRTTGTYPSFYEGNDIQQSGQCTANHKTMDDALQAAGISDNSIGDVKLTCFIEALWQYVNGGTSTLNNTGGIVSGAGQDWINLIFDDSGNSVNPDGSAGPPIKSYDSLILAGIKQTGIDQYNVTLNTIKNLIWLESKYNGTANSSVGAQGFFQLYSQPSTGNFAGDLTVALNLLKGKFSSIGAMPGSNCAGPTWLLGIRAYNGLPGNASDWNYPDPYNSAGLSYPVEMLGQQQCNSIASGSQAPSIPVNAAQTGWPFQVYGALGVRVHQVDPTITSKSDPRYGQVKGQLTSDINTSLSTSLPYIQSILTYCATPTNQVGGGYAGFSSINQSDTFAKAVSMWYSDWSPNNGPGDAAKVQASDLQNVVLGIQQLYNACVQCQQQSAVYNPSQEALSELANLKLQSPVPPQNIGDYVVPSATGKFGAYRLEHPDIPHQGIDIAPNNNQSGSPIVAAAQGTVIQAGPFGKLAGQAIVLLHDSKQGVMSWYFHLGTLSVSQGQTVAQGQVLGTMGATGDASGPCLHFGVSKGTNPSHYSSGVITGREHEWGGMDPYPLISPQPQLS